MAIVQIGSCDQIFRVMTGDGMQPEFHPGDELFINFNRDPHNGDFVVAKLSDLSPYYLCQLIFSQGQFMLSSLDPNSPVLKIPNLSFILGVVVYRGRPMECVTMDINYSH